MRSRWGMGTNRLADAAQASLSTEELVRRWAGGERERVSAALYHRLGDRLWRFAHSRLRDRSLADDVVQDVFLRAWKASERFDPAKGSATTWLFAIANNVVNDAGRTRSRRLSGGDGARFAVQPDPSTGVDTAVVVRAALEQLSRDHREVLALAYDGGLSQQEVSVVLNVPLGTVKTRTYHALRHLRVLIGAEHVAA